ncbi:hypothetical protein [Xanthobacter aminoxidans]|uniref:hypothetical protein n=1 Tax=Xanthobacter aminoxidans TaxID=186280 RepID=UPI002022FC89|nr:hypothetical protein [Xanthobacter aminoxidans]MCL8382062.1 hypothetical protein [Xanthobacter aminoxidans]
MFTVVTPAGDRKLLTSEQMRVAAGLSSGDTSQDATLGVTNLGISDLLAMECGIAGDGVKPPTLKSEVVKDTVRLACPAPEILLSRRFITDVASVSVDGTEIDIAQVEIDRAAGLLTRICNGRVVAWWPGATVVTYTAGFTEVPGDLVLAVTAAVREMAASGARDPFLKRDKVEGIGEQEFWVGGLGGSDTGSAFSATVRAMLDPYRSVVVP